MTNEVLVHSILIVLAVGLTTAAIRFSPFLLFSKRTPRVILYLGEVLPFAIMGMLVVYCLKNVTPLSGTHGIPEFASVIVTVLLHKWKHNMLLSIVGGTALYMVLVQTVF